MSELHKNLEIKEFSLEGIPDNNNSPSHYDNPDEKKVPERKDKIDEDSDDNRVSGGGLSSVSLSTLLSSSSESLSTSLLSSEFCGYTPYYTTAVWVGYDSPKTVNDLYGSTYPGRIWHDYMDTSRRFPKQNTQKPFPTWTYHMSDHLTKPINSSIKKMRRIP